MGQEESHNEEMDLAQIQDLCIIFMKECPSGALHLHEFKRIFGVPSTSAEESLYIETIFHSFDTNRVKIQQFVTVDRILHFCGECNSYLLACRITHWISSSMLQHFT